MRKRLQCFLSTLLIFVVTFSNAQESQIIRFPSGDMIPNENIESFDFNTISQDYKYENGFYTYLQFNEIPTQELKEAMEARGIQFPEYMPYNTYLAFIPSSITASDLLRFNARAIVPIDSEKKISHTLIDQPYGDWAKVGDQILVIAQRHKQITTPEFIATLNQQGIQVVESHSASRNVVCQISEDQIELIAQQVEVRWVELIQEPGVPEDTRGRGLHRANALDQSAPSGRHWNGVGVNVLCRDDGSVGPHIDFQGRIRNMINDPTGTHGDGVSGIMSGAGNLNPYMRGMASGSFLYVVQYQPNFLDGNTLDVIADSSVVITNSSYSDGCNAGYTTGTQTVDTQIHNDTDLLHVFSAGNSNGGCSSYGAGSQWGNITGGHKQAKNCLTTANLDATGNLAGSSSRGPAYDGRIKPDISANGLNHNSTSPNNSYQVFGGTSAAAPGIAGISAMLYQAYKETQGGGNNPESALIKATILNTANDLGNVGPDFKFGYGHVNALRAAMLIEDGRFLDDNISQGNMNSHTINVPVGTQQVRFMLYWNDPEASPGANPSLVNNLDLVVKDPSNNSLLPLVLDETPNAVTLDLPATNGVDDLNNMEQVVINLPASGDYTIEVTGTGVPMGPQHYFVVYEIKSNEVTVTYPIGGEGFVPGETEIIHWDAYNASGDFDIEYSTDSGSSWNAIASVSETARLYQWNVPNDISGQCLVRVTNNGNSDTSEENFSIADLVTNVSFSQVCIDEATVAWTAVSGADSYDVYLLGDMYMDSVGTTTGTSLAIPILNPNDEQWVAVRAEGLSGWKGRRTIAVNHSGGLLNCSLTNDIGINDLNSPQPGYVLSCDVSPITVSINVTNTGIADQSNFDLSYQLDNNPPVSETYTDVLTSGQQVTFDFTETLDIATSGVYTLKTYSSLLGDENSFNDTITIVMDVVIATGAGTALDFVEEFDVNGMPPSGWNIENPDNSTGWAPKTVLGSDGINTLTAWMDNENYNAQGQLDIITTELFDLQGADTPLLLFDLAKAQYSSGFNDALRVQVSSDCGATYTEVYFKDGLELSTIPNYTTVDPWNPGSADDWRQDTINLSAFTGNSLLVEFVNINGYSNATYIDNIELIESNFSAPAASFTISNSSLCVADEVTYSSTSTGGGLTFSWDFGVDATPATANTAGPHTVSYSSTGSKTVTLDVTNTQGSDNTSASMDVIDEPNADFSAAINNLEVTFTNASTNASSYFWDFGDGNNSTDENPVHTYATNIPYEVILAATNGGCEEMYTETVFLNVGIEESDVSYRIVLAPNPASSSARISISDDTARSYQISLYNAIGEEVVAMFRTDQQLQVDERINIQGLSNGIYFVKISSDEQSTWRKLMVAH